MDGDNGKTGGAADGGIAGDEIEDDGISLPAGGVAAGENVSLTVSADSAGMRADLFCAGALGVTRSYAQKLLEAGLAETGGRAVAKNYRVRAGEVIDISLPPPAPAEAQPQDIPLDVVYEDGDVIVVNKPKGMVVHPAPGNPDGTLVNALLWHCRGSLSGIGGVMRPGIVHRIDRDTSGLLVVAKNDDAHLSLAAQLKVHSMTRRYEAVVAGDLKDDEGTIDAPVGRDKNDRKRMAVTPDGRSAVTHYRVLERFDGFDHIECRLETGRTHQIRVHMAYIGHHVIGDPIYARGGQITRFERSNAGVLSGQCLHARVLGFDHPRTGERMLFTSELPEYFRIILEKLKSCDDQMQKS